MRRINSSALAFVIGVLLASPALAQQLTNAELEAMLKDSTSYIEFTGVLPATGKGPGIVYNNGDKVSAKFPNGRAVKGTRTNKDNTTCIQWEGQQTAGCSKFIKKGDKIEIVGVEKGEVRGVITRSVPGNPEKL